MRSRLNEALRWTLWDFKNIKPEEGPCMTVSGTTTKFLVLLSFFVVGFVFSWSHFHEYHWPGSPTQKINTLLTEVPAWQGTSVFTRSCFPLFGWALFFAFFVSGLMMKRGLAVLAPICVTVEGVSWGALEHVIQERCPGLTLLSAALAIGMFLGLLALYRFGVADFENPLVLFLAGAVGGLVFAYAAVLFVKGLGINVPFLHQQPTLQTWVVLALTVVGAGLLVNRFAQIDKAIQARAPRWAEWKAALWLFGFFLGLMGLLRTALANRSARQMMWDSVMGALKSRR